MLGFDSTRLTLLIGPTLPLPAPAALLQALLSVEVTQTDEGPSGFQIAFGLIRTGLSELADFALLAGPTLDPFNRVIVVVTTGGVPKVLIDGVITHREHTPSVEPGSTHLVITGEDVSVMMDLKERRQVHPFMSDDVIALLILLDYSTYQLMPPIVVPPLSVDVPLPIERIPTQIGTDRAYLQDLAQRNGYTFYVEPGPLPGQNLFYWGPPRRVGIPQPALRIGMGGDSNVSSISFAYDALAAKKVSDTVQDSRTGARLPLETAFSTRPPLATNPALSPLNINTREVLSPWSSGLDYIRNFARAQAMTDRASDGVLTATGELDANRYGGTLSARSTVGMRGAGASHDGLFYVKTVTHHIEPEVYTQKFVLTREGTGTTTPVVPP